MKVIFLDIDGVLNYQSYFIKKKINKDYQEIDINKLIILKEITTITNSYVVITSSWRILKSKYIELINIFKKYEIPIIGKTDNLNGKRGAEIKKYLYDNHNIDDFIIIDDDIFDDYDEYLLSHLVKTSFYENGLELKHIDISKRILTKKIN